MVEFSQPVVICECTVATKAAGFKAEPDFKVAMTRVPVKDEGLHIGDKKYRVTDVTHLPWTKDSGDADVDRPCAKLYLRRVV